MIGKQTLTFLIHRFLDRLLSHIPIRRCVHEGAKEVVWGARARGLTYGFDPWFQNNLQNPVYVSRYKSPFFIEYLEVYG
ncbi:hypothetical protein CUJ83_01865 [Methanocella sp. CWC-04]|uniref:Uncharacterized protein n=1 Tax=Methanooceanicella nereidis TaxID=2052831 RepID=A0AAP2W657_9EURY|nr:hypothetical protein [Methanocella sp. CWC-04]